MGPNGPTSTPTGPNGPQSGLKGHRTPAYGAVSAVGDFAELLRSGQEEKISGNLRLGYPQKEWPMIFGTAVWVMNFGTATWGVIFEQLLLELLDGSKADYTSPKKKTFTYQSESFTGSRNRQERRAVCTKGRDVISSS